MKILIITYSEDNYCVENVTHFLEKEGHEVYHFFSDLFPLKLTISGYFSGLEKELKITDHHGKTFLLNDLDSIWYRRLRMGGNLQNAIEKPYIPATIEESKLSFWGILNACDAFQFDYYEKHRIAANKFKQLQIAASLGMNIPPTLVTNDMSEVRNFYKEQDEDIIMKMHHSFAIYDESGQENVVFTNQFTEENLEDDYGLQLCPLTFQKKLHKKRELRITVIGDRIFSAAVDSQKLANAQLDWRKEGEALLNDWYQFPIPKKLEKQILKLMDIYQLNYGALDFIQTEDGKYHFLEINSGGEYMWLDLLFQQEISKAIAEILTGKRKRRTKKFPLF